MALKPTFRQAILIQESIDAALHSGSYTADEKDELRRFSDDLDYYLTMSTL